MSTSLVISTTPATGGVGDIPSLYIIATGTIYIKNNVTNLSGVYVAQSRTDSAGTSVGNITTCATTNGSGKPAVVTATNLFGTNPATNCGFQLTVDGAFVAKHVTLLRTFGSLKNSTLNESVGSTNSAETFIGSPEMYLSVPRVFRTSPPYGTYDSITSLPPVL